MISRRTKYLLEPSFKEKVISDKKVVFAGKIGGNEEMLLVAVP
ncbi:hypothetical protein UF75_4118 [Desulfosporosinus sp. I2]|nr:hypothetical protein UF75_4118 [Desulfosporosinus sp. I2]